MRHRRIGSTDLVASEVGLAVGPLVAGPGARSDEDAAGLLGRRPRPGDRPTSGPPTATTAAGPSGCSARRVRGHRDEVTVATTFGYDTTPRPWEPAAGRAPSRLVGRRSPAGPWTAPCSGCGWSRSTCGCCTIRAMDAIESDELFEFLEAQVAKGKVRAYGVALGPGPGWGDEGAAALQERRVAAVETVYNVAEPAPGRELAAHGRRDRGRPGRARPAGPAPGGGRPGPARVPGAGPGPDPRPGAAPLRPGRPGGGDRPAAGAGPRPPGRAGRRGRPDPPTPEDLDLLAELHAGGSR